MTTKEQIDTVIGVMTKGLTSGMDVASHRVGPSGLFSRMLVSDPGNPGGQDPFGGWKWPPDTRWETDEEFRSRIKESLR